MNSLKTLLVAAVLAAGGYGIYYSITHRGPANPATSEAPGWPSAGTSSPTMQIPGPGVQPGAFGPTGGPAASLPPAGVDGGVYGSAGSGSGAGGQFPPLVSSGTAMPQPGANMPQSGIGPWPSGATASQPSIPLPQPGTLPEAAPAAFADANRFPFATGGTANLPPDAGGASAAAGGVAAGGGTAASGGPRGGGDPLGAAGHAPGEPPIDAQLMARFNAFMEAVQARLDQGRLAEAHLALSTLYDNPDLPAPLARQVTQLLDQLAGTVIYSRGHYLEPAYHVRPGETLEQIAEGYQVPWLLLARINGIADPEQLQAGQELKVVRGPFSAVIHLERFELTLILNGRYAGRFAIGVGGDAPELLGAYTVREKITNPAYYGLDGSNIAADDPRNPLGEFLLDLGDGVALHGTDDPSKVGRLSERGIICLAPRDIDDLFGILSIGSQVVIER